MVPTQTNAEGCGYINCVSILFLFLVNLKDNPELFRTSVDENKRAYRMKVVHNTLVSCCISENNDDSKIVFEFRISQC